MKEKQLQRKLFTSSISIHLQLPASRSGCYRERKTRWTWSRILDGVRKGRKMSDRLVTQTESIIIQTLIPF